MEKAIPRIVKADATSKRGKKEVKRIARDITGQARTRVIKLRGVPAQLWE